MHLMITAMKTPAGSGRVDTLQTIDNLDVVRGGDAVVRGCRNGYFVAEDSHSNELYAFDPKSFTNGRFPTDDKRTSHMRWLLPPGEVGESADSRASKWCK